MECKNCYREMKETDSLFGFIKVEEGYLCPQCGTVCFKEGDEIKWRHFNIEAIDDYLNKEEYKC